MTIRWNPLIEWEPLHLKVHFVSAQPRQRENLEAFLEEWNRDRDERKLCHCHLKSLTVERSSETNAFDIWQEWLCRRCVERLAAALEAWNPSITMLEVGDIDTTVPDPAMGLSEEMVRVPAKEVEFEDGAKHWVEAFSICRFPVTSPLFERFVNATGYLTTAETQGAYHNWRENPVISTRAAERRVQPVVCVSYFDAVAYSQWRNARLPTEAEWMASSIVDERIYDHHRDKDIYQDDSGQFIPASHPNALKWLASDWTATCPTDNSAVIRNGPQWARMDNWQTRPNRFVLPKEAFDLMFGFRVILL